MNENSMGQGRAMGKRDVLKKIIRNVGLVAGLGVAGLGATKLVQFNNAYTAEHKKHLHVVDAVIVRKISSDGSTGVGYHPVSVSPNLGGGFTSDTEPDVYKIVLSYDGKEVEKKVKKAEFGQYAEGQKFPVVYDDETKEITSTEEVVVEYYRQNP